MSYYNLPFIDTLVTAVLAIDCPPLVVPIIEHWYVPSSEHETCVALISNSSLAWVIGVTNAVITVARFWTAVCTYINMHFDNIRISR